MALVFTRRAAGARGKADFGWLQSRHSFSFGQYHDPKHMQFANLRVINDDIVQGGEGFGLHPHQNAEIFSYVLAGALEHKDTLGNGSIVQAGGVQFMSAGSGISHSEFNPSKTEAMRFLQVWLLPEQTGTQPYYENLDVSDEEKSGKLKLFLSHDGRDGSIRTQAKADVFCATLNADQTISTDLNGHAWIQLAEGALTVNGHVLEQGDGLAAEGQGSLEFTDGKQANFLLFKLG